MRICDISSFELMLKKVGRFSTGVNDEPLKYSREETVNGSKNCNYDLLNNNSTIFGSCT